MSIKVKTAICACQCDSNSRKHAEAFVWPAEIIVSAEKGLPSLNIVSELGAESERRLLRQLRPALSEAAGFDLLGAWRITVQIPPTPSSLLVPPAYKYRSVETLDGEFSLPVAIGILAETGIISPAAASGVFCGDVSIDGAVRQLDELAYPGWQAVLDARIDEVFAGADVVDHRQIQTLSGFLDAVAAESQNLGRGKDAQAIDPKGNIVLESFDSQAFGTVAVVFRPGTPKGLQPFVVAYAYDEATGEWGHGLYTDDLGEAHRKADPAALPPLVALEEFDLGDGRSRTLYFNMGAAPDVLRREDPLDFPFVIAEAGGAGNHASTSYVRGLNDAGTAHNIADPSILSEISLPWCVDDVSIALETSIECLERDDLGALSTAALVDDLNVPSKQLLDECVDRLHSASFVDLFNDSAGSSGIELIQENVAAALKEKAREAAEPPSKKPSLDELAQDCKDAACACGKATTSEHGRPAELGA